MYVYVLFASTCPSKSSITLCPIILYSERFARVVEVVANVILVILLNGFGAIINPYSSFKSCNTSNAFCHSSVPSIEFPVPDSIPYWVEYYSYGQYNQLQVDWDSTYSAQNLNVDGKSYYYFWHDLRTQRIENHPEMGTCALFCPKDSCQTGDGRFPDGCDDLDERRWTVRDIMPSSTPSEESCWNWNERLPTVCIQLLITTSDWDWDENDKIVLADSVLPTGPNGWLSIDAGTTVKATKSGLLLFAGNTHLDYNGASSDTVVFTPWKRILAGEAFYIDGKEAAGYERINWDSTNRYGGTLSSGVYILQLMAKGESGKRFVRVQKMLLLK